MFFFFFLEVYSKWGQWPRKRKCSTRNSKWTRRCPKLIHNMNQYRGRNQWNLKEKQISFRTEKILLFSSAKFCYFQMNNCSYSGMIRNSELLYFYHSWIPLFHHSLFVGPVKDCHHFTIENKSNHSLISLISPFHIFFSITTISPLFHFFVHSYITIFSLFFFSPFTILMLKGKIPILQNILRNKSEVICQRCVCKNIFKLYSRGRRVLWGWRY